MHTRTENGKQEYRCSECGEWEKQAHLIDGKLVCQKHWLRYRAATVMQRSRDIMRQAGAVCRKLKATKGQPEGHEIRVGLVARSAIWADRTVFVEFACETLEDSEWVLASDEVAGMEVIGYTLTSGKESLAPF